MMPNLWISVLLLSLVCLVISFQESHWNRNIRVIKSQIIKSTQILHYKIRITSTTSLFAINELPQDSSILSIDILKDEVSRYMNTRSNSLSTEIDVNKLSSKEYQQLRKQLNRKANNPFAFLQPTGWFKDEIQFDIDKRSDKTVPVVAHPLSFIELNKYGFSNLSSSILALGGPFAVGQQLQLDWQEPIRRAPKEEVMNKRPKSSPGRLALGGAFEESLSEAAEKLDLTALKSTIQENLDKDGIYDDSDINCIGGLSRASVEFTDNIDYSGLVKTAKANGRFVSKRTPPTKTKIAVTEDRDEKFKLVGFERAYTLLLFTAGSVGYGRASKDLLSISLADSSPLSSYSDLVATVTDIAHVLFPLLLLVSVINAGRSGVQAQSSNRNVFVWTLRSFLGGPGVLASLKSLPPAAVKQIGS